MSMTKSLVTVLFFACAGSDCRAQTINSVVNAASLDARLSPGALALVNGAGLGDTVTLPITISGKAAAVITTSPTQYVVQIPIDAPVGPATLQFGNVPSFPIVITQYAPALFTASGLGYGNLDGAHADGSAINDNNPAFPGETITMLATGLGPVNPPLATGAPGPSNPQAATVVQPTVLYASETGTLISSVMAPGRIGIYQLTVRLTSAPVTGTRAIGVVIAGSSSGFAVSIPIATSQARPLISRVLSAAGNADSVQSAIQPGSWAAIYGSNFTAITKDWADALGGPGLPTALGGVKVTVGGKAAAVSYVSPAQINIQVPSAGPGPAEVVVTNVDRTSDPVMANVQAYAPAFFHWGATRYAVASRYPDYTYVGPPSLGTLWSPAVPGEIVILWGTGFGPSNPAVQPGTTVTGLVLTADPVTVRLGGVDVAVLAASLSPGLAGVYQIAIRIPAAIPAGDLGIWGAVGGYSTPENVFIAIGQN